VQSGTTIGPVIDELMRSLRSAYPCERHLCDDNEKNDPVLIGGDPHTGRAADAVGPRRQLDLSFRKGKS
jgi:hypothetical protein